MEVKDPPVENVFDRMVSKQTGKDLHSDRVEVIQANIGLRCNQCCSHCHVAASPARTEIMQWPVMEKIVEIARGLSCRQVDITGGAPEMNPNLKRFIVALREAGVGAQVRTNFTALLELGNEALPEFFRDHEVQLVGSLPCYSEENVDGQRGAGVYRKSIEVIRQLNNLGYGRDPELKIDLVYNPAGPTLPPEQGKLEADYRQALHQRFGIYFTRLLTITNLPIGRFLAHLREQNKLDDYCDLLYRHFNPATLDGLMCRHQISVGWDGTLYDCDFNLALGSPCESQRALSNTGLRPFSTSATTHRHRRPLLWMHCRKWFFVRRRLGGIVKETDRMPEESTSKRGIKKLSFFIGAVVLLSAALKFLPINEYMTRLLEWTRGMGAWGPVIVGAIYIPACVLMVPGSIISLGAGLLFGVVVGTMAVSIGSTLGACAAFLVGRTIARDWITQKVRDNEKFSAISEAVAKEGFKIVLLTRLSPVFPFNLLNYAYGLTMVPFWKYALASWIGMLPGTVLYVYIGSTITSLSDLGCGATWREAWRKRRLSGSALPSPFSSPSSSPGLREKR